VFLDLSFSPEQAVVGSVRRFVIDFYERILDCREVASRIGVATHELVENAIKCSVDGEVHLRIEIERGILTVRTRNRAAAVHLEAVRNLFHAIEQDGGAAAHYARLLGLVSKHRPGDGAARSGLGLTRIWVEADMALSCEIAEDIVIVEARTCLHPKEEHP